MYLFVWALGVESPRRGAIQVGELEGDVNLVNFRDPVQVVPVHFISTGADCPPWAQGGNRKGKDDARATCFESCVDAVIGSAEQGYLLGFCMETVKGVLQAVGGSLAYLHCATR